MLTRYGNYMGTLKITRLSARASKGNGEVKASGGRGKTSPKPLSMEIGCINDKL